jgi:hypothetical protein
MELLERDPEIQELGIRMIWLWLEISKPLKAEELTRCNQRLAFECRLN